MTNQTPLEEQARQAWEDAGMELREAVKAGRPANKELADYKRASDCYFAIRFTEAQKKCGGLYNHD